MHRIWKSLLAAAAIAVMALTAAAPVGATVSKPAKVSMVASGFLTYRFNPKSVAIAKGRKVKWTNDSSAKHNIVFTDGAKFYRLVKPGASVTRTFRRAGTFHYHCTIHRSMKGVVTVG